MIFIDNLQKKNGHVKEIGYTSTTQVHEHCQVNTYPVNIDDFIYLFLYLCRLVPYLATLNSATTANEKFAGTQMIWDTLLCEFIFAY